MSEHQSPEGNLEAFLVNEATAGHRAELERLEDERARSKEVRAAEEREDGVSASSGGHRPATQGGEYHRMPSEITEDIGLRVGLIDGETVRAEELAANMRDDAVQHEKELHNLPEMAEDTDPADFEDLSSAA